ncbi:MAG TPA: MBL fold metallo-hydrolase [Gelria sp.]|nr:MBL fold metallo-hydrolase [Gelria sp.]
MLFSVVPGISLICPPAKGKFPYSYSVLIEDQIRVVIDTSFGKENLPRIQELNIDVIINTHFHYDHIMYNHCFPDAEIWAHYLDAPCIRSLDTFMDAYGCHLFAGGEEIPRLYFQNTNITPSPVHRELHDGEVLNLGKTSLQVVHTPGHTPGHCAFWEEKHGILISGDIDLAGFGPWYGHYCSDLDDLLSSIEKCRELNPKMLLSGHKGLVSQDINSGLITFRDVILRKEEKVLQALSTPHTLDELAAYQFFYGKDVKLPPMYQWFEKLAMYQHLKRLKRLGLVGCAEDKYYKV